MLYREIEPEVFLPWSGEPIDNIAHDKTIETLWTAAELTAIGLYVPADADEVQPGKVVISTDVRRIDGVIKFVHELQDVAPSALDVDREHDRRVAYGKTFTVAGYGDVPLEGSLRTQTVLLALKDTARDLLAAGIVAPILLFTDRDGVDHNLTPDQMIELVNAGKAYMDAVHQAKRGIKALNPIPHDYADDSRWP